MHMKRVLLVVLVGFVGATVNGWAAPTLEGVVSKREVTPREQVVDAVIEATQRTTVSSQISGRIIEVSVDVDDFVNKGDVIVRFRDNDQRSALNAAIAKARESQANFQRITELYRKELVSRSDYDRARAGAESTTAAQEQAQEQLDNTIVRAPYAGIVVARHVEVGETASPGKALVTGISLESLRAIANVPQMHMDSIRTLSTAWVILPTQQDKRIQGTKLTFSPYADPATHTFRVRVDLPKGTHALYPGMYTKVAFIVDEDQRLLIPVHSVVHRGEVTGVYILENQKISFRQIRVGRSFDDGRMEVLAGLDAGETVAKDPIRAGVALKAMRQNDKNMDHEK